MYPTDLHNTMDLLRLFYTETTRNFPAPKINESSKLLISFTVRQYALTCAYYLDRRTGIRIAHENDYFHLFTYYTTPTA